ncbi:MAG: ABC transporter permease [Deltaproteobacteria bacterium]|nr:ABC transporter permease [Deltaproteobacteria bacterium]MCB9786438.1 ABC transporter permease [Deltaproteobacteria bacterium]
MKTDRPERAEARPRHPLVELTRARLIEFIREPSAIFWVFVFPVLLTIGLGIAFRDEAGEVHRLALVGEGAASVASTLSTDPRFAATEASAQAAHDALRAGRIDLALSASPPGAGSPGWSLHYRYDPSNPRGRAARRAVDDTLQRALGRTDVASTDDVAIAEPGSRYIDFLVPGLLGVNLMGTGLWGIGYAIVQSRRKRLMRRFAVTPMRRSHFLLSYIIARFVFMVFEVVALLVFAGWAFDVTTHGSLGALAAVVVVGTASFAGLSVLVASRTSNAETASGLMNLVMLPMWVASGVFFSYERFPEALHPVVQALPLTALIDALRAVMNQGQGLGAVVAQLGVMALWGGLSFAVALKIFRWQ